MIENEANRVNTFLLKHPEFAINIISAYYPLTESDLDYYSEKLNWIRVPTNEAINWSEVLYYKFENKIFPDVLADNTAFPWKEDFIELHKESLFYCLEEEGPRKTRIGSNTGLPWSEEFIQKYEDDWDWEYLSRNTAIPFTVDLISWFKNRWDSVGLFNNPAVLINEEVRNHLKLFSEFKHSCKFCNKSLIGIKRMQGKTSFKFTRCPNIKMDYEMLKVFREEIDNGRLGLADFVIDLLHSPNFECTIQILEILEDGLDLYMWDMFASVGNYLADVIKAADLLEDLLDNLTTYDFENTFYKIELVKAEGENYKLDDAIDIKSEDGIDYKALGYALESENEPNEKVIDAFNKAAEFGQLSDKDYYYLANLYGNNGEYDKAVTCLNRAIEINPNVAKYYSSRGISKYIMSYYGGAENDIKRALMLDEYIYFDYSERAMQYAFNLDYDSAVKMLNRAILLNKDFADAYYNRGVIYARMGEIKEAYKEYDKYKSVTKKLAETKKQKIILLRKT